MRIARDLLKVRTAFRNWPAIAIKGGLWKHFDLPRREIALESRGGTRIAAPLVRNAGAMYTAVEVFALGAYKAEWDLEDDPVVVDIGANIGAWILWVAEQRPRVSGVCFEPDPAAAAYLRRNLRLNGVDGRVQVRPEAVSDRSGTAHLFQEQPGGGVSSLEPRSSIVQFERETVVPTVTFAKAIERVDGDVSIVKMDCEGSEYDIVEASPPESWRRVRRVVMEYHPAAPGRHEALRRSFGAWGFEVVQEECRAPGLGTLWLAREAP